MAQGDQPGRRRRRHSAGRLPHGDYLRSGAIARFSPVMDAVTRIRPAGGLVLGICNGFQVLLEAGLLPGAMMRNRDLQVPLRARRRARRADGHAVHRARARRPGAAAAHRARRRQLLRRRRDARTSSSTRSRVVFRYCDARRRASTDAANPNGSIDNIAGICNEARNVFGLMPHPERACEPPLGSADGLVLFDSVVSALAATARCAGVAMALMLWRRRPAPAADLEAESKMTPDSPCSTPRTHGRRVPRASSDRSAASRPSPSSASSR